MPTAHPAAVRQLAARARGHINARAPRVQVSKAEHDAAVTWFLSAAIGGDMGALLAALDPDVVLTSDGGVITVNGAPGLGVFDGDELTTVVSFTMNGDRISRVDVIRAPLKLRKLIQTDTPVAGHL